MIKQKNCTNCKKKAKEIQKDLKNTEIESKSTDETVVVVITADQKIKELKIAEEMLDVSKKKDLEEKLIKVVSEGLSRAQAVAAEKTKSLMGDMGINIPGM